MIPGRRDDRWFEKEAVIEALATVPPVLAAVIGALASLADPRQQVIGWWLVAGAVWMVGASAGKVLHARAQDRERKRADDYEGLRAALQVLFAAVCEAAGMCERETANGKLRITMHRVVPCRKGPPEELEQLLPYVGGAGDVPGRRFSIRSGIIGKAARKKLAIAARRQDLDYEDFVEHLILDWAYTEHDAPAFELRPARVDGGTSGGFTGHAGRRGLSGFARPGVFHRLGTGFRSRRLRRRKHVHQGGIPMNSERHEGTYRETKAGYRWRVTSRPGAGIHVEELEMTDRVRRGLTGGGYLPPPNLDRWRPFWNLPKKG